LTAPTEQATTMLWASSLAAGIGVSQLPPSGPTWTDRDGTGQPVEAHLVLGLSLRATPNTQIAWQREVVQPIGRPNFVLRPNDPYSELRRGRQLKMIVSRNTTMSVRPQSGGVGVTLSSRW